MIRTRAPISEATVFLVLLFLLLLPACGNAQTPPGGNSALGSAAHEREGNTAVTSSFKLEAWADNWFAVYLGDFLLAEDSVPITTERSFNAEVITFDADYQLNLNFVLKDFKQNDTGLEYIGARNQQMGDGGFIMQLTDLSLGEVVAVSDEAWRCTVIHKAPLDKVCEQEDDPVAGRAPCKFAASPEPEGWKMIAFDDSAWNDVTTHTAREVRPKGGYDTIQWDPRAQLIWSADLETDNTLLCRLTVASSQPR